MEARKETASTLSGGLVGPQRTFLAAPIRRFSLFISPPSHKSMTFDSPDAEDTCLKNHPYRHTFSSAVTTDECTPTASGDLEKIDSRHHEDDDHIDVNREQRRRGGDPLHHPHGGDGALEHNLSASYSTSSTSVYARRAAPSTLPERVASRMSTSSSALTFPEGGLHGWLAVVGSFCAMLSVFGLINSSAVFESYFSEHQLATYSASQIGWIFSIYLFCVFFVGIQVGPIFDRYGSRWLVAIGSLLIVLSLMLLGLCEGEQARPARGMLPRSSSPG